VNVRGEVNHLRAERRELGGSSNGDVHRKEKKMSPPISPFSEHKRWKLFFLPFWFPNLFMNSCSMLNISLIKIKKIRWTDPISLPCCSRPANLPPTAPSSPIAAAAVHRDLYAAHRDRAAVPAR